MYDPARDDDPHAHRYPTRLLVVAIFTIGFCVAIYPSVTGFQSELGAANGDTCVALRDGWHADRRLTAAQIAQANTPGEIARANDVLAWRTDTGGCVPEARHRLIMTGLMLADLGAATGALAAIARRRRLAGVRPGSQPDPAWLATHR